MKNAEAKFWGWRWITLTLTGLVMFFVLVAWAKLEERNNANLPAPPATPTPEIKTYQSKSGHTCLEISRGHQTIKWLCDLE